MKTAQVTSRVVSHAEPKAVESRVQRLFDWLEHLVDSYPQSPGPRNFSQPTADDAEFFEAGIHTLVRQAPR